MVKAIIHHSVVGNWEAKNAFLQAIIISILVKLAVFHKHEKAYSFHLTQLY